MIKNYFTTAWRNLSRNRVYSFINISGLSIGLACAMLILLYVKDELSFDKFHKNVGQVYRITSVNSRNGEVRKSTHTGFLQGPKFSQNVAGIKSFVRVQSGTQDIKKGTDVSVQELLYVDSNFFSMFSFPLLAGDKSSCLTNPHSVVLSEAAARRNFGSTDIIGKTMLIKEDSAFIPFTVTAVAKQIPQNSSIQFEMLLPFRMTQAQADDKENWFNFFLNTFVLLDDHALQQNVEAQMQQYYLKDASAMFKTLIERFGGGPDMTMGTYTLQPFTDMHLSTDLPAQNGLVHASNPMYTYILSGIALFILLIACINFINLTVARSVKRAKEIGIRKVIGGNRRQLIYQFMGESLLLCSIAFILAIGLVHLLLPVFNQLSNKALALQYLFDPVLVLGYIGLFLATVLLAGFYPALVLSGYQPVHTLYSRFNMAGKNYLQKSLVVLQFTLASFLIIATFTIHAQFNFLTRQELGYDDKNLVLLQKDNLSHTDAAVFKHALQTLPGIEAVSARNSGGWQTMARVAADSNMQFAYETIDEAYLPLMKIPILAGRNFSVDYPSDSNNSVIVNETFVKQAGWKNPIGQTVDFFFNKEKYTVIGVVKDHHFSSLNEKIIPQLFTMKAANMYGCYYVKIKPGTTTATLASLQKVFKTFYPLSPYSYVFKDAQNTSEYESVQKWKQILLFGAVLTIFISCIGLFGLSVLAAQKRTKEIGIRKVLGASVQQLVSSLSADFLKLVGIALVIAIPVAYMAGGKWLQSFPYRIELGWWLFAAAAMMVILIALCTVSFQAVKAAMANPVKSLRTE